MPHVCPSEVEGLLGQHPSVKDVAVIGVPHDKWGESAPTVGASRLVHHEFIQNGRNLGAANKKVVCDIDADILFRFARDGDRKMIIPMRGTDLSATIV